MALRTVINYSEIQRYKDLGLGRGVNVTDPQMWRNKSPFLIRNVAPDLSNIIGTEESGIKEHYEKEVSTVATQQLKIKLALDEPSSRVKIGIDVQNSQSTSFTRTISGTKVGTRIISFQIDFDDLPVYTSVERISVELRERISQHCCDDTFELGLYSWILERIKDRQSKSDEEIPEEAKVERLTGDSDSSKLTAYLEKVSDQSSEIKEIANDCKVFVKNLGITHYVSAIELGALIYRVFTTSSHHEKLGAGAELGAGQVAQGGVSGKVEKSFQKKASHEQEIGRIGKNDTVERNTDDEAVIGFQIQPVHKLIRLQYIKLALQVAIKEYIQIKGDNSGEQITTVHP